MQRTPALQITSTGSFQGPDRFSYWADVVTQTFVPLQCDTPDRGGFCGDLRHRQIGLVGITDVQASPLRAARTPASIARTPRDDLIVVLQIGGTCHASQNASAARLLPGDGAIVTTDECYFFEFPGDFRQLVFKLPSCLMAQERIGRPRERSLLLSDGPAKLLQRLALSLLEEPMDVSAEDEVGIEHAFADLLGSAARPSDTNEGQSEDSVRYVVARQFIRQQLTNPALKPATVVAHVGMSTGNLGRLFARRGTSIERTFWMERLDAARQDLVDPRLHESSVTDIAFSWAFNDAAHFSRRFSKAYGVATTAYRAAHLRRPLKRT
jgi:AraC-like DNA-binding protein